MCRRSDGQTLEVWPASGGSAKAQPLLMGAPLFRNTAGGRCVWVPWAVSESLIARTRPARGLVFPKEKGSTLGDCYQAEQVFHGNPCGADYRRRFVRVFRRFLTPAITLTEISFFFCTSKAAGLWGIDSRPPLLPGSSSNSPFRTSIMGIGSMSRAISRHTRTPEKQIEKSSSSTA